MATVIGFFLFAYMTRDLSPWIFLLLCLGFFLTIAALGAWEGGRRVTPYTRAEQAQLRTEERASRSVEIRLLGGIILVIILLSLARGLWYLWS